MQCEFISLQGQGLMPPVCSLLPPICTEVKNKTKYTFRGHWQQSPPLGVLLGTTQAQKVALASHPTC